MVLLACLTCAYTVSAIGSKLPAVKLRSERLVYPDSTRARSHKAVIRPSVTQALHDLNITGVYADWYDKPSAVGPAPFDYLLPPEWQATVRWTFVVPDTMGKHFYQDCTVSPGPRPAYFNQDSLDEEVSYLLTSVQAVPTFHVMKIDPSTWHSAIRHIMRKPDILVTFAKYTTANDTRTLALKGTHTVHVHVLEECGGWNCAETALIGQGQITLARHAFELYDLFEHHKLEARYGEFNMHLFAHWPWLVDPEVYYPLKSRTATSPQTRRILDVDGVLGYHRQVDIAPIEFRQAELCLFTSTKTRKMSRDWVKAMLSGCVILSDLPTEIEEALSEFIVTYEPGATSKDIAQIAQQALQDRSDLRNKALRAFIYARQHFIPQRQIGRLLQLVEQHRAGVRGYEYPLPFSLDCRQYPDGHGPGWCT